MCGLVGVAGNLASKDEGLMKAMLLFDYFRGTDSTGFAAVKFATNEPLMSKIASHPLDLFDSLRFRAALNGAASSVFMGHNRAATRGGVNANNAHPFICGNIVGAHNGTLSWNTEKRLAEAMGADTTHYGTDSDLLFAAIDKLGIETAIGLCDEGRTTDTGAWSLVWYDLSDKTLNFLRNKWRPMWYAYDKDFTRLFWASQWETISSSVALAPGGGYDLYEEGKKKFKYFGTEADVHYKFPVADLMAGGKSRPKPLARPLKGREPAAVVTTVTDPFGRAGFHTPHSSTTNLTTGGNKSGGSTSAAVIHLIGDLDNPLAGFIQNEDFEAMAKSGCQFCGDTVQPYDLGISIYDREKIVLCASCTGNDGTRKSPTRIYVAPETIDSMQ